MSHARLADLIAKKQAVIGVIGLGYVGLPLVRAFTAAGFRCMGFDVDQTKVDKLNAGQSYIKHIGPDALRARADLLGWTTGLEPATAGTTSRCSTT